MALDYGAHSFPTTPCVIKDRKLVREKDRRLHRPLSLCHHPTIPVLTPTLCERDNQCISIRLVWRNLCWSPTLL